MAAVAWRQACRLSRSLLRGLLAGAAGSLELRLERIGALLRLGAFRFQRAQPVPFRQPLGGGGGRIGGGAVAVPAPQIALAADKALACREQGLQAPSIAPLDQPGMAEPPVERTKAP